MYCYQFVKNTRYSQTNLRLNSERPNEIRDISLLKCYNCISRKRETRDNIGYSSIALPFTFPFIFDIIYT